MHDQKIKDDVKCCACGGSIADSRIINFVCLPKLATWIYPVWGNPVFGALGFGFGFASAIVCDKCIRKKADIKFAVQWDDGVLNVKYHPIDKLEDIPKLDPAQIGVAS